MRIFSTGITKIEDAPLDLSFSIVSQKTGSLQSAWIATLSCCCNGIIVGESAKKYKEQIKKQIKSKKNGPFVKSLIADDEATIKKLYSSLGFNFLEIKSKVEKFPKKIVNVYFELDKGEKTKISKINFKGDRKIRDRRLRDIITSQEAKFWKIVTRNL